MKKYLFIIVIACSTLTNCNTKEECSPGNPPEDNVLYLRILNSTGSSYTKYPSGVPDSFKILNLTTNALVTRSIFKDSLIELSGITTTNGTTAYKIMKGTILKPDTVTVTVAREQISDICGERTYDILRLGQVKTNTLTACNGNCIVNNVYNIQR